MGRLVKTAWVSMFVAVGAASAVGCGSESAQTAAGPDGSGGSGTGGTGGVGTTTTATTTSTTATTTTTTLTTTSPSGSGGSGSGGGEVDCDPAAPAGSLYALSDTALDENVVSMCKYRGDVLLIVNVAEA